MSQRDRSGSVVTLTRTDATEGAELGDHCSHAGRSRTETQKGKCDVVCGRTVRYVRDQVDSESSCGQCQRSEILMYSQQKKLKTKNEKSCCKKMKIHENKVVVGTPPFGRCCIMTDGSQNTRDSW